jgi:hypothetical protein
MGGHDNRAMSREVKVRPRSKRLGIALVAVLAMVVTACGSDGDGEGTGSTTAEEARTVIRFSFAPDPVWDYMTPG